MLATPLTKNLDIDHVYEPAEDTFLFLDLFESLHNSSFYKDKRKFNNDCPLVVEIGSGSGLITTFISQHRIIPNAFHIATDINLIALENTTKTYKDNTSYPVFDVLRSNLTDAIIPGSIDVLFFNPPYVPSEHVPPLPSIDDDSVWLDLALIGGDDGMLITRKVLSSLNRILAVSGHAYILFCARNNHPKVIEKFKEENLNFSVELTIQRKCGWEELAIYRFTKTKE